MHINKNTLVEPLTSAEKSHLKSCQQCTYDQETLYRLNSAVEQIELLTPPEGDWLAIQQRMANKTKVKRTSPIRAYMSIAASILVISVGWLAWTNHHLQGQLEQVLQVNQSLEIQLIQGSTPTFQQTQLLSKIMLIEMRLAKATTTEEQLLILRERQEAMTKLVISKQGKQHEFSI
jgi:hypothetical protein